MIFRADITLPWLVTVPTVSGEMLLKIDLTSDMGPDSVLFPTWHRPYLAGLEVSSFLTDSELTHLTHFSKYWLDIARPSPQLIRQRFDRSTWLPAPISESPTGIGLPTPRFQTLSTVTRLQLPHLWESKR
jgi:hypothetical protein